MDDLNLLRDLGAGLQHEPPPTLVRQRDRFLRDRPRRRWTGWWAAGLVAVATAAAVAVPALLVGEHLTAAPGAEPVDMSGARNVLVIGSDSRDGEGNAKYGPQSQGLGRRSDTIMIVHVPADRSRVRTVSVPRDSMVSLPRCGSQPAGTGQINSAYNTGGAACLKAALEKLTGLRLDHTVEVDFAGFKNMVDAIGGVRVKVPQPVNEPKAKLKLSAGEHLLNGEAALGWARLRYVGDGSDAARIKRQQTLLRAMLRKAQPMVLTDPGKVKDFLGAMRGAVRTDLSLEEMYELGKQLADTKVSFVAVPSKPWPQDRNRLQWKQPEANKLFKTLK